MAARRARFVLVVAILIGVGVLFAARGSAGSKAPSSLGVTLLPSLVTVGQDGVGVARFTASGNHSATNVVVSVTLPPGTSPVSISSLPSATCTTTTLSCSFGTVSSGSTVKVFVRFTATTATAQPVTGSASATFAHDVRNASSNGLSIEEIDDTAGSGKCTTPAAPAAEVHGFTSTQRIFVKYPPALPSLGLPCTPVATGIDTTTAAQNPLLSGFTTDIAFVFLPQLSGSGLARVVTDFAILPPGTTFSTFVLKEIPGYPSAIGPPFPVSNCVAGAPPSGQDSCILSRAKFGSSGAELVLMAYGLGGDPAYGG